MSMLLHRAGLILPPGPTRSYNGSADLNSAGSGGSGTTTATWANVPIGAASPSRLVALFVSGFSSPVANPVSATIGGVAAAILLNVTDNICNGALIAANLPTGTTADVVVSYSANVGTASLFRVWSYSLYNLASAAPTDTGSDTAYTGTELDTTLDIAGPAGIVLAMSRSNGLGNVTTWTGAAKDADNGIIGSTASAQNLGAETGRPIVASVAGSLGTSEVLLAASWG